ncbi:MAG: aminoacetone oxidase family FAD-binding enzyme, partial [Bacillota bacterium]
FPVSDKSSDVLDAFSRRLRALGVTVKLDETVLNCRAENGRIIEVTTNRATYKPDAVITATGGLSYPLTGSTGDGYKFASNLGHSVIKPCSALCPIILSGAYDAGDRFVSRNTLQFPQGLSLKNVSLKCAVSGKKKALYDELGEMLFMDNGISGPLVLSASSKINRQDVQTIKLSIDLKPALSLDMLDQRLLRDFKAANTKQFKNALNDLLPKSLISYIICLSNIDEYKPVNVISKEERMGLAKIIKSLTFKVESLGTIKESIITAGGVSTKEISPTTMQSKLVSNLYFAGEVIDVDALTGGFNLQVAFSTAYLAGKNAQ